MRRSPGAGFTLIELMIVVGIIGILAMIALPVYNSYTIRSQVVEGIQLASAAKGPLAEAFFNTGSAPDSRLAVGLSENATDTQGSYVSAIDIQEGAIVITYGNAVNAKIRDMTLALTPYESSDRSVVWRCGAAPAPLGLDPLGTAGGGAPAVHPDPTVPSQYLPADCR